MADGRRLVVGVGNPERGDDALGWAVVSLLEGRLLAGIEALHRSGEATAILKERDCRTSPLSETNPDGGPQRRQKMQGICRRPLTCGCQ